MPKSRPDAEVIADVLAGDREAFAVLVDRYQGEFARYAARMVGSNDEAADVLQESFVRAYRFLHRCGKPDRFKGWLFRIVRNQCHNRLASRSRREAPIESAVHLRDADDPAGGVERQELAGTVREAVRDLPADQREVVVLRYIEGLTLPEIAELVEASLPAVKMRLLRAREALRHSLEDVVT